MVWGQLELLLWTILLVLLLLVELMVLRRDGRVSTSMLLMLLLPPLVNHLLLLDGHDRLSPHHGVILPIGILLFLFLLLVPRTVQNVFRR